MKSKAYADRLASMCETANRNGFAAEVATRLRHDVKWTLWGVSMSTVGCTIKFKYSSRYVFEYIFD